MTTTCYSVQVKSLRSISRKAIVIEAPDGTSDIFPKSEIYGIDRDDLECDAYFIAEWILNRKKLTWTRNKKKDITNNNGGNLYASPTVFELETTHIPDYVPPVANNDIESLRRPR